MSTAVVAVLSEGRAEPSIELTHVLRAALQVLRPGPALLRQLEPVLPRNAYENLGTNVATAVNLILPEKSW